MANRTCPILDCSEPVRSSGMCNRHYQNKKRYGHAQPIREWPLIARLMLVGWDVTERGCWEWRGDRNDFGYGRLSAPRLGLDKARVHRIMWEMHHGPIADGLSVRHRCDNPPCVNPDHLELGTHGENMQDMADRRRSRAYMSGRYDGVCLKGVHDVSQPGALRLAPRKSRKPEMVCVQCDKERKAAWASRKRKAA